jgi:plasmid stability protein
MKIPPVSFHVRFPPSVFEKLRTQAEQHHRSIAAEILTIVEEAVEGAPAPAPRSAALAPTPRQAIVQPLRPIARPSAPAIAARSPGAAPPISAPTAAMERQAIGVAATINEDLIRDRINPASGPTHVAICRLLATAFPDVRDLAGARAQGVEAWLSAGATPGLISRLFPDDKGAMAMAKSGLAAIQAARKLEAGSEIGRFIAAKGILGRGAHNLRTLLATHFAGMSIDEAVQQGSEAWLDAGVGEDVARKIFGEPTAIEARRRAYARDNAKKRAAVAS